MNQPELRKHAFSVMVIERIFLHGDSVNDILALSFSHSPSASKFNMKKHHLTNFNAFDSRCNFKCHCGRKSTSWRAAWRAERWILHTTSGFKPGHKNANRASTSWWKSWLFSDKATSLANLCFSSLAEHYAMRSVLYSGEHFYPGTQTIDNDIRNVMSRHHTFGITKDAWKALTRFVLLTTTSQHHQNLQESSLHADNS